MAAPASQHHHFVIANPLSFPLGSPFVRLLRHNSAAMRAHPVVVAPSAPRLQLRTLSMDVTVIESQYNEGLISKGEALTQLLNIFIPDRSNEDALGAICGIVQDINTEETKLGEERVARLFNK